MEDVELYKEYEEALRSARDYFVDENGNLCSYDIKGVPYIVANFLARPILEIIRDDGVNEERTFRIEGLQNGTRLKEVEVTAEEFLSMTWPMKCWGMRASIRAGYGMKDQCRDAIQILGLQAKRLRIYTHVGWHKLEDGTWGFLHANGCISSNDVTVEIEKGLRKYAFPPKVKNLKEAAHASKALLEVAPMRVTVPLLALCYLAPLHHAFKLGGVEPNFLLWLYGGTGTRKTTLGLLFLCHFGKFNGKNPPASFKDTSNAIERKAFATKDVLLLVDDYHPESSTYESRKMAQVAQMVLRMFGDRIGRGRLKSTIEFQQEFPPRGEALVTGEDLPIGQSSVARFLAVEMFQGDIDLPKLTESQAKSDLLSEAMRGYIEWLMPNMDVLSKKLSSEFKEQRTKFQKISAHGRIAEAGAWLSISFHLAVEFFLFAGVCNEEEGEILISEAEKVIVDLIDIQNSLVNEEKPVDIFLRILKELLVSGKVRLDPVKQSNYQIPLFASGDSIGWEDNDYYYLRPEITYNLVNKFLSSRNQKFPILERALWKQLDEAGLIKTEMGKDGKIQRCLKKTVPKMFGLKGTERLRLLHLKKVALDTEDS